MTVVGLKGFFFLFSVGSQASLCVDMKKCTTEERICMMCPHISSFQHALVLTNDRMGFFFPFFGFDFFCCTGFNFVSFLDALNVPWV